MSRLFKQGRELSRRSFVLTACGVVVVSASVGGLLFVLRTQGSTRAPSDRDWGIEVEANAHAASDPGPLGRFSDDPIVAVPGDGDSPVAFDDSGASLVNGASMAEWNPESFNEESHVGAAPSKPELSPELAEIVARFTQGKEELSDAEAVEMARDLLYAPDLPLDFLDLACDRLGNIRTAESAQALHEVWSRYSRTRDEGPWAKVILDSMIQPWIPHTKIFVKVFPLLSDDLKAWSLLQTCDRRSRALRDWVNGMYDSAENPNTLYGGMLYRAYMEYRSHPRPEKPNLPLEEQR